MQALADALAAKIPPECIWTNHPVESLQPTDSGTWMVSSGGRTREEDAVVLAISPAKMLPLIGPLDTEWIKLLGGIPAHDSATLNLGFDRKDVGHALDGFGFVVPAHEKKMIVGCTFASRKFEARAPEGFVLLRVFLGPEAVNQIETQGEDAVVEKVLAELKPILNIRKSPVVRHLALYHSAMTYFKPGHLSQAARLEQKASETKGLYLAGNGFKGVGIPDCISAGETAADKIFQDVLAADSPR
jgi:protoporphyrinogen/coproporphyrinogen III oxidase